MNDSTPPTANLRQPSQLVAASCGAVALLSACADLIYVKHPHVYYERWFNFYGFFAALAVLGCLVLAFVFRPLLTRPEDYYHE